MNAVDLHVHSNKSDGSFSPAELVSYALEKGLSAFASITGTEVTAKTADSSPASNLFKLRFFISDHLT